MKSIKIKIIRGSYHFDNFKFADECDIEDIKKLCAIEYEPIMQNVGTGECNNIILKNGGIINVDNEDFFFKPEFEDNETFDAAKSFCTIYTDFYSESQNKIIAGEIFEIPADFKICTLVLKKEYRQLYENLHKAKKEIDRLQYENNQVEHIVKLTPMPNYLTQDEINFLNN